MGVSRRPLAVIALVACLAATGASCSKDTPATASTPGATAAASPTPSATPTVVAAGGDVCALVIRIGNQSGIMVGTHYISPLKETLDQLKALVNLTLAARDELLAGTPPEVRASLEVELAYFQSLKDHDFAGSAPQPAGFDAAEKVVNQWQVSACGITFDQ